MYPNMMEREREREKTKRFEMRRFTYLQDKSVIEIQIEEAPVAVLVVYCLMVSRLVVDYQ